MAVLVGGAHVLNEDKREQDARDNANPDLMVDQYCERITRDSVSLHDQFMRRATGAAQKVLFELTKDDCKKIMADKKAATPQPVPAP
ncbi:hypothetical protein [Micavibrio aeruginosavorus]|uniref:hypothetical protein n=1 Tax=Micavibrio aeruginosavorus TaxID=349221 RepID=UPI003F4A94B5